MKEPARIRAFTPEDYDEVIALWRESGLTIKPLDTLPEIKKLLARSRLGKLLKIMRAFSEPRPRGSGGRFMSNIYSAPIPLNRC
jgi:hypothetical protein